MSSHGQHFPQSNAEIAHGFEQVRSDPTARTLPMCVAGVIIAASLLFIGGRGIWEPDEGRYTAVAMQMLQSGDWLRPHIHHELAHFTKPPLTYWCIASSVALFGQVEWAARLYGAIAFGLTAVTVGLIARRLFESRKDARNLGLLAAVVYATSALPFIASNIITTDTLLTFWETLGMLGLVYWWTSIRNWNMASGRAAGHLRWNLLMWVAFAMAFMTKGPPGLLPLAGGLMAVGLVDGWRSVLRLVHPMGLLVFLAAGGWWYAYIILSQPELFQYFLHDEVYARVATGAHHRNAEWYMAFMYLPLLLGGMLPWSLGVFTAAARQWPRNLHRDPALATLLCWVTIPLLVFMLSSSRLPLYILPLMPPLAIAAAKLLPKDFLLTRRGWSTIAMTLVVLLGVRVVAAQVPSKKDSRAVAATMAIPDDVVEIVYIEKTPRLGLSFYFNREIEYVTIRSRKDRHQTLAEELDEQEGALLLVVRAEHVDEISRIVSEYDWTIQTIDNAHGDDVHMTIVPPADRRDQVATSRL